MHVAIFVGPLFSVDSQETEWSAFQVDHLLLDNRGWVSVSHFNVHHAGEWKTAWDPLLWLFGEVFEDSHIACYTGTKKDSGDRTEAVAVAGIEGTWGTASSLITEEMVQWRKLGFRLSLFQYLLNACNQEFFGFDLADGNVAVWVSVQKKLSSDLSWDRQKGLFEISWKLFGDKISGELSLPVGQQLVVKMVEKLVVFWDEFNQTFWY